MGLLENNFLFRNYFRFNGKYLPNPNLIMLENIIKK
jgi:hypothetical protein